LVAVKASGCGGNGGAFLEKTAGEGRQGRRKEWLVYLPVESRITG
jgi:hypothetical protein